MENATRKKADRLAALILRHRLTVGILFAIVTLVFLVAAFRTQVDAGFTKRLPLQHEYIQTFLEYQHQFGGADRVLIAFTVEEGDIFTADFFELLRRATDEAYYIPGVDRASVSSIWTPNVRFIEIVEDGFAGGNVVPADFSGTASDLSTVRANIMRSGRLGELVARDFSGALIAVQLQEVDPSTGTRLDYLEVARHLEETFRTPYEEAGHELGLRVHIIGFAKVMGDISDGALSVVGFFVITLFLTGLFAYLYAQSHRLSLLLALAALVAVVWQLGLLRLIGFGIDPMSILVPFLVFAIGVSHGVQMVRSFRTECLAGHAPREAAERSLAGLLIPGSTALVTDLIGFLTILSISVPIIRELAITASLGVFSLFFTNLILLPILLSGVRLNPKIRRKIERRRARMDPFWSSIAYVATRRGALLVSVICAALAVVGYTQAIQVRIGDMEHGVPELRDSSRYNQDSAVIAQRFNIGVNILTVICESHPDSVVDFIVMDQIDRLSWHLLNTPGVHSVQSLPMMAKVINQGWNEGSPKWYILPRNPAVLSQAISPIDTSTGLLNPEGSVIPVYAFLTDHKAETIDRAMQTILAFAANKENGEVKFRLASGNIGVMGATNEVVAAAQFPMLILVFTAVIIVCLLSFRSWRAALCIVLPLALVSVLAYALMHQLRIGLKVSTLPVVALGVGVGVDYGIYLFHRLRIEWQRAETARLALVETFRQTGSAVIFTGLTLAAGVATWNFSPLKFQADMGLLLTFMFLFNMLGAVLLLPALAHWLLGPPGQGIDRKL